LLIKPFPFRNSIASGALKIPALGDVMAKYNRNSGKPWSKDDVAQLKKLAKENTPTGVISLKLGRTEGAVYTKASQEEISLRPTNKPPYNRRKKA
jgi:hypothetical protein